MTTVLTRLIQARNGASLITKYITDNNLTKDTFSNAQPGTHAYMVRAAMLKEFEAVAEKMHFSQSDPIRQTHTDFWLTEKKMYGMRDIIAHKYGVTSVDYDIIWSALNPEGILAKTVVPDINQMIQEYGGQ